MVSAIRVNHPRTGGGVEILADCRNRAVPHEHVPAFDQVRSDPVENARSGNQDSLFVAVLRHSHGRQEYGYAGHNCHAGVFGLMGCHRSVPKFRWVRS